MIILAALLTTSCGPTGKGGDATVAENTDESATTMYNEKIIIAEGGVAKFTIIRADKAADDVKSVCVDLRKELSAVTGANFTLSEDWISPKAQYDENAPEILIGFTNRQESGEALDGILYGDYSVRKIKNKLVISAYTAEGLKTGADALIAALKQETNADGKTVYYISDSIKTNSGIPLFFSGDRSIEKYKIIYNSDEGNLDNANKIAKQIQKVTGILPEVLSDNTKQGDYEIIVGESNRELSKTHLNSSSVSYRTDYFILTEGNNLLIAASTGYMTGIAADVFCGKYLNPAMSDRVTIPVGASESALAYVGSAQQSLSKGANLRIMSWNILSEEWDSKAVFNGREYVVAQTLLYYEADVLGLQELSPVWYAKLKPILKGKYEFIFEKNTHNSYNYTGLAYNAETVKLLDSGIYYFKNTTKPRLRAVTWGLFERLDGGEKFIVMNTHWAINSEGAHLRFEAAEEMAELALSLIKKHNVAVFITGDYNCSETSDEYKLFLEKSGFADPKYDSEMIGIACSTYHTIGVPAATDTLPGIDHITVSKDVELLYYNTLIDDNVINSSDHLPIYIDVFIK